MLATSKDNGDWDGKGWWWWKREYWGIAAVNIENVEDSDEELVHLHDLHFLDQVVFLPLSSVLLQKNLDFDDRVDQKVWRSSRWPRWCLFKDWKKRICVYSCLTGCFVKPIPISSGKPTPTLRLPRLSNRKHISICSDWFWPARLGPRHGHPLGWALFWLTLRFLAASRS